jgi:micrococcal nuclease
MLITALLLTACHAVDGDTIRCAGERIRLIGIDAPEMRGHCRRGRVCVKGDPVASKRSLAQALQSGPIRIDRMGTDSYVRTLGMVRACGRDLSCWQLVYRHAIYKPQWDTGGIVARTCR